MRQFFGRIRRKTIRLLLGRELFNNFVNLNQTNESIGYLRNTITENLSTINQTLLRIEDDMNKKTDNLSEKADVLSRKTDILSGKTDILTGKTASLSEKTDSLTQRTDGLFQKTASLSGKTDSLSEKNDVITQRIDGLVLKTASLLRMTSSLSQRTAILLQQTTSHSRKTDNLSGKTNVLTQETNSLVQKTDALIQKTEDLIKETDGLFQNTDSLSRKTDNLSQKTDVLTQETNGLAQKTDGLSTKTEELTLETKSLVQKTDGLTQKADIFTQEVNGLAQKTEGLIQKTDVLVKETSGLSQEAGILTQETKSLAQKTDGLSKKADSLVQKTDGLTQKTDSLSQKSDGLTQKADANRKLLIENHGAQQTTHKVIVNTIANTLKRTIIEHLDFILTDHCNLNCKGCSVFAPIAPKRFADPEASRADFTQLHKLVGENIQQIHLLGGEPLLHPQIEQFAIICRSVFHNARIDFTTNGLMTYDMPSSFWEVLRNNDVAIKYTRYPVNFDYDKMIEYVQDKGVSVFSAGGEIKYFRRIPLNTKGTFNIHKSYLQCPYVDCPQLRDGKLYRCPACAAANILNEKLCADSYKSSFRVHAADYLNIHKVKSGKEVLEFLCNPIPFCQYCDMDHIDSRVPWEASNRDIKEWVDV